LWSSTVDEWRIDLSRVFPITFFFVCILLFSTYTPNTHLVSASSHPEIGNDSSAYCAEAQLNETEKPSVLQWAPDRILSLSPARPVSPVSGLLNVLAIPVQFSDFANTTNLSYISAQRLTRLSSYYDEVSYGQVSLNISILKSWLTLPQTHDYYGADSRTEIDMHIDDFIRDSLNLAEPYVDYHDYGYVILIHAGRDQAQSSISSDIWSEASLGKDPLPNAGGVDLGFTILAESDPYGVFAHEFGHNIELPDLYDYLYEDDFVDSWSLMGDGNWLNPPASLMAPEKMWLGWISNNNVTTVDTGQIFNIVLSKLETPGSILAAKILSSSKYYTVEYRRRILTDAAIPSDGVIVSYVDDNLPSGQGPIQVQNAYSGPFALQDEERYIDAAHQVAVTVWTIGPDSANVTVQKGFADLLVDKIQSVGAALAGQDVYFDVSVNNTGVTPSNAALISLRINGTDFQSKELPPVPVNSTAHIQFGPWQAILGLNAIQVVADVHDYVVENNKTNNVMSTSLHVYPPATIIIDRNEISNSRVNVDSDQKVYFHATWSENLSDIVDGTLYVNDVPIVTNATGWATLEVTSASVGDVSYKVTGADFGGFTFFLQQNPDPHIVWDTLEVYDFGVSKQRCDVNSSQIVWIKLRYGYDANNFDNSTGTLRIGEKQAEWDTEKDYWYINDSRQDAGQNNYTAPSSFEDRLYGLTSVSDTGYMTIIWDQVVVTFSLKDQRANTGSPAEIEINGTYAYDSMIWNGIATFNDTLTKNEVGAFDYTITSITDPLYGLVTFTSNVGTIIFDRVKLNLTIADSRINVGEEAEIHVTGTYEYDNSTWNGTFISNDTLTKSTVGNYGFTVTTITDPQYHLSAFECNTISIVWDRVNVTLYTADTRISVKTRAPINWTGAYEYDGKPWAGNITLSDNLTKNTVGTISYRAESVSDTLYGLTVFASNTIQIVFDDLISQAEFETTMPGITTVKINLNYESDGTPLTDADVTIESVKAQNVGNGEYVATLSNWSPYATCQVDIEKASFIRDFSVSSIVIGNTALLGVIATIVAISVFFLVKRKKPK
jgi:M6 family metalloprotease-like protein